jgi:hypothetical protein
VLAPVLVRASAQPVWLRLVEAQVLAQPASVQAWARFLWASERSPSPLDGAYLRAAIPWLQDALPELLFWALPPAH